MTEDRSNSVFPQASKELERSVYTALKTYSNVHRGSGHNSMVTTALFEGARDVILECMNLEKEQHMIVFGSPMRLDSLERHFDSTQIQRVSSRDIGLPLGIGALAIERRALPKGALLQMGGGTVNMVYSKSVIWANPPARFEAGTPSIINAIALAKGLQLIRRFGRNTFKIQGSPVSTSQELLYKDEFEGFSGKELLQKLRLSLVGHDVRVPTVEGEQPYSNLDNAASTPTFEPIWQVAKQILWQPHNFHIDLVSKVKEICAEFLGAPLNDYDVLFTSNTTEAINIVAQFLVRDQDDGSTPVILTTLQEHNSNELPWRYISGVSVNRVSIDDEGFLNLDELERMLREYNQLHRYDAKRIRIVAVSGASNVIGSIFDVQAISQLVHQYGARLLVDGAQVVAHRHISLSELDIDYFAFSGHKVYAPFGSGALVVKKELINLQSDDVSKIKMSGEENVVGIATLGKAIILLQRIGMETIEEWERMLTHRMLQGLAQLPDVEVFGVRNPQSPRFSQRGGIIAISLKKVPHNLVAKELAELGGIGIRNGCFCAHLLVQRILRIHPVRIFATRIFFRVLPKLTNLLLPGLIRVSFGVENNENDVDHFIQTLRLIDQTTRSRANILVASTNNGTIFLPVSQTQNRMIAFTENIVKTVYSFDNGIIV
ncbi:MAG: aminotransferase class V-fold PLP-dependent enzyme [Candidatus Hermodarchaeota archaeon]|nr:aminotransferase class V-fold PLP-dependent enzyme [Candidatus Hermodarchaeota archaeon]